jgi:hypothetical protein
MLGCGKRLSVLLQGVLPRAAQQQGHTQRSIGAASGCRILGGLQLADAGCSACSILMLVRPKRADAGCRACRSERIMDEVLA